MQVCYHPERLEAFVAALEREGLTESVAVLPSILLVRTAGGLEYVDDKVAGISVPAGAIERVRGAHDEGEAAYRIALEQARLALSLPGVRGLHLIDFRRDGSLTRLCLDLGLAPRSEREAHAHGSAISV